MSPPEVIVVHVSGDLAPFVPEYLDLTRADLEAADGALARGEMREVRTLGHNLKGSGTSFGLPELSRLGRLLEAAAGTAGQDYVRRLLDELRRYLSALVVVPAGGAETVEQETRVDSPSGPPPHQTD